MFTTGDSSQQSYHISSARKFLLRDLLLFIAWGSAATVFLKNGRERSVLIDKGGGGLSVALWLFFFPSLLLVTDVSFSL